MLGSSKKKNPFELLSNDVDDEKVDLSCLDLKEKLLISTTPATSLPVDNKQQEEGGDDNEWAPVIKKPPASKKKPEIINENAAAQKDDTLFMNYNEETIKAVESMVNTGLKVLVIMRGLSGSGKSTLAK